MNNISPEVHCETADKGGSLLNNWVKESQKRIYTPVLKDLFDYYLDIGLQIQLSSIMREVPEEYQDPFFHTLITHVTKEKPVFIYSIGAGFGVDKEKSAFMAAITDILWTTSLMVDDVVDEDTQRANRGTCWVLYGKERTMASVNSILGILYEKLDRKVFPRSTHYLVNDILKGMESFDSKAIKDVETVEEEVAININKRAMFHCEFPVVAMLGGYQSDQEIKLGSETLYTVNMEGQILNDVKDLVSTNLYGRKSFSDIRGGIMTIPLVMLYKGLNEEQKRYFCSIFGHRDLTNNELENFHEIVYTKLPRFEIFERVRTGYSHFLELMGRIDSIY